LGASHVSTLFSFSVAPWERRDLAATIANNAACRPDGPDLIRCASHVIILGAAAADRRTLEGLLYVRRVLLPRLRAAEFDAAEATCGQPPPVQFRISSRPGCSRLASGLDTQ
jgi:hypothetical protein